ncbi:MAG: hypothetical protein GX458_16970 [Phyllobacteriaceae bacterium]|nr:hypothetical protein [Phyllobacteriaceae bacterium]
MRASTGGKEIDPAIAIVVAVWLTLVAVHPFSSITIDWASFLPVVAISGAVVGIWAVYARLRPDPRLAATAKAAFLVIVFSLATALLNYHGFDLHRPLVDGELAAIDRALGLDWWGFVVAVKSNAVVSTVFKLAYLSSLGQIAAVILILGAIGRVRRLERFVVAFMVGALISVAVWCVYPSFGALPHAYAGGMADAPFDLAMDPAYARSLLAHHAGDVPTLRFDRLIGLIGCPSFHTVMAITTVWAVRDVRFVGPVALVLNLVVVAAVPADGGHHFVDAFAGIGVAVLAIAAARALVGGAADTVATRPAASAAGLEPAE